ncbi:MAG: alpha/beta fold hydrolase [Planctomycetes bacterium]|nr:alpha/beta fold hydrolase [Planctomycetota bacterium]
MSNVVIQPPLFRPLPLLGNPHLQTVLSHLFSRRGLGLPAQMTIVPLPDGDRLAVHASRPALWRPADGTVLLIHGLGGSHRSAYLGRLSQQFHDHGLRTLRLDLRGVGAGERLARKTYHGGSSADVRTVIEHLQQETPAAPLVVVGMSLGGNIALKLAGEAAKRPLPGFRAVAALAPPIDLVGCAGLIALKRNRIYERYYVGNLIKQVRQHRRHHADMPALPFRSTMTLREFDDMYTAPTWGFADGMDYYRRASALPLIDKIAVPTFILVSRDDPFIITRPFEELGSTPRREVHVVNHGGHMGFLGWDGAGGIRWAERAIARWVIKMFRHNPR